MSENFLSLPQAIQDFTTPYKDMIVTQYPEGHYDVIVFSAFEGQKFYVDYGVGGFRTSDFIWLKDETYVYYTDGTWRIPSTSNGNSTVLQFSNKYATPTIIYSTVDIHTNNTYSTLKHAKDPYMGNTLVPNKKEFPPEILADENFKSVFNPETDGVIVEYNKDKNLYYVYIYPNRKETETFLANGAGVAIYWYIMVKTAGYKRLIYDGTTFAFQSAADLPAAKDTNGTLISQGLFHDIFIFTNVNFLNRQDETSIVYQAQKFPSDEDDEVEDDETEDGGLTDSPLKDLPQAIQNFKTPYSDMIVMRTHTEGTYLIRTFVTSSENQKVHLDSYGKLVSNEKFVLHEYGTTYNELTDAWAAPSGKKTTSNSNSIPTVNSLTSPADIEQVLYSTVDLYDSTYTEIQREKDARINCLADDYYTLNEQVLKIEQISEVYDPNTDGLFIAVDNDTYFYVCVIKNVGDTYLQVNYKSYCYFYPSAPVTVHKFTITRKDTTYKTSSTKEYGTGDYIHFKNTSSSWLREDIMFTTMSMVSKMDETYGLELIKAQKMPSDGDDEIEDDEIEDDETEDGGLVDSPLKDLPQAIQDFKTPYTDMMVIKLADGTYDVFVFSKLINQKFRFNNTGYIYTSGNFVLTDKNYNYNPETDEWKIPTRSSGGGNAVSRTVSQSGFNESFFVYSTVDIYSDNYYTKLVREKDEPMGNVLVPNPTPFPSAVLNDPNFQKEFNPDTDAVIVEASGSTVYVYVYPGQKDDLFTTEYYNALGSTGWYVYHQQTGYTLLEYDKATWEYKKTTYDTQSTKTIRVRETLCIFPEAFIFTNVPFYSKTDANSLIYPAQPLDFESNAILPESFEVNPASIEDFIGTQHQLAVTVLPDNADNKAFTLASTNPTIATVTETGLVELKAEGQTVITITSVAVPDLIHQVPVTVNRPYEKPVISNLRMEPSTPSVGERVSFIYDKNMDSRLTLKSENWGNKKDSYESGTHTVTLSITDSADQTSNTLSHTFTIEKPLENFTISNLRIEPSQPKAGEEVVFYYDLTNDDRLTLAEEVWENKQASYEAGTYTVTLYAVDSAGRQSNTLSLTFDVAYVPEKPVLTAINMTPSNPYQDETVEFTYQAAIDEQATIKEEIWENKQSMYTPGRHEVALTLIDSFDQSSNRLTYEFEVQRRKQMPVIRDLVVKTQNPTTNDVIEFEYGMTLDSEATLLKENWENKREKYPAGVHTVKLTITDSLNQVSNVIEVTFTVLDAESLPDVPSQFPYIYDITIDPPQPRAGELLSYSYTVALEAGTEIETMSWKGRRMVYEEEGEVELSLQIIDSKGNTAEKSIEVTIAEPSELPQPPKPTRIKHLEVTRWDSAYKRFMILEGREK